LTYTIPLSERDTIVELKAAIRHSNDEAQKTRIRAIISIKEGLTRTKTAQIFNITRTTLRYWVTAYNGKGVAALLMSSGGRPKGNHRWNANIFDEIGCRSTERRSMLVSTTHARVDNKELSARHSREYCLVSSQTT